MQQEAATLIRMMICRMCFRTCSEMKALWFIVFAWLFFGGTTVPAKRANREVKSLPTEHLDCLDELFHKVQGSGTESWEVMEPPGNAHASRFAVLPPSPSLTRPRQNVRLPVQSTSHALLMMHVLMWPTFLPRSGLAHTHFATPWIRPVGLAFLTSRAKCEVGLTPISTHTPATNW